MRQHWPLVDEEPLGLRLTPSARWDVGKL